MNTLKGNGDMEKFCISVFYFCVNFYLTFHDFYGRMMTKKKIRGIVHRFHKIYKEAINVLY